MSDERIPTEAEYRQRLAEVKHQIFVTNRRPHVTFVNENGVQTDCPVALWHDDEVHYVPDGKGGTTVGVEFKGIEVSLPNGTYVRISKPDLAGVFGMVGQLAAAHRDIGMQEQEDKIREIIKNNVSNDVWEEVFGDDESNFPKDEIRAIRIMQDLMNRGVIPNNVHDLAEAVTASTGNKVDVTSLHTGQYL